MASLSGYYAAQALAEDRPPEIVAQKVNEGIGVGFEIFFSLSILALIITAWS